MKPLRNSIHKFLKSAEVTFFEGLYRDYFTRTLFFAQQYLCLLYTSNAADEL